MVKQCVFLLVLLFSTSLFALSKVEVSVNQNPVLVGEYFVLNISADGKVKTQPDTSVLLKDFVVGPLSASSQQRLINGTFSQKTIWSVELMSRKAGEITIPAFTLDGVSSKPFTLKVTEQKTSQDTSKETSKKVFIKTSLKPEQLYVQQAGIYTVKLYLGTELLSGDLTTPTLGDTPLNLLQKQQESYEIIDGRRYLVISRNYLIQPQKSGAFTLNAPKFTGKVRQNRRAMGLSASAPNSLLDVKPIPAQYQGAWLPSELVDLSERYQGDSQTVEVGTPITRSLTLTALNVTEAQLPDIELPPMQGMRSYADKTERNQLLRDGRLIAQLNTSIAYVPQQAGSFTLPEIRVPWFNTVSKRTEYATVPAKTLNVVANPNAPQTPPEPTAPATLPANETNLTPPTAQATTAPVSSLGYWGVLACALGYVLWLITLLLWYVSRKKHTAKKPPILKTQSPIDYLNAVKQTVQQVSKKQGEQQQVYHALLAYANAQFPHSHAPLHTLSNALNQQGKAQINALQATLYSNVSTEVDLPALITALEAYANSHNEKAQQTLKPLY